jgi:hypothetical protein
MYFYTVIRCIIIVHILTINSIYIHIKAYYRFLFGAKDICKLEQRKRVTKQRNRKLKQRNNLSKQRNNFLFKH